MKKVLYRAFGGPEVLELADVAAPEPKAREVLVRVKAAAINPVDWKMREGQVKFLSGWRFPQGQGLEFAGIVERVGSGVTAYKVGDEVFGAANGCLAEMVIAMEQRIAKKPLALSFEAASTIPVVGTTAASLFRRAAIGPGSQVLVNGATGGIGMFVTQMAVQRGAEVTAVVSQKGAALVQRWGVARVVDYREVNVVNEDHRYDVIVELSDKLPFKQAKSQLKPKGTYVASLPNPAEMLPGFLGNLVSARKYALMGMDAKTQVLSDLAAAAASGSIEIVVGQTFALSDFRLAYAKAFAGVFAGKVVVTVAEAHPR